MTIPNLWLVFWFFIAVYFAVWTYAHAGGTAGDGGEVGLGIIALFLLGCIIAQTTGIMPIHPFTK